jgi:hypothetical protein
MKLSSDLTLQRLAEMVGGQILFPPLPPLGGSWEPVLGLTAAPCISGNRLSNLEAVDLQGAAVWLVGADAQTSWWCSQQAFSAGALAVISAYALVPPAGRVCIQAAESDAACGVLTWCHLHLSGSLGVVLRETCDRSHEKPPSVMSGDDLVGFAVEWLNSTPCDDIVVELSIEKKNQLMQQFVLPRGDFLGIYSLAVGTQRQEQLLIDILSFVASGRVSWLSKSSPIMLAPECWHAPPLDHPEWSRVVLKSPGVNYQNWIDELRSQKYTAETSSSD